MSSAELRRCILIALAAGAAMFVFLAAYDEPMSASCAPALRTYHVRPPVLVRRVGRRGDSGLGIIQTADALNYLDTLRASIAASMGTPPASNAPDPVRREPEPLCEVPGATGMAANNMQPAAWRVPDEDRIGYADLIRPEEYDFGRYKSMAVRGVKREDVRGFLHLPLVWGSFLEPAPEGRGAAERVGEAVRRFTDIQVTGDAHVYLDSPRLLDYPVLFLTARYLFDLTPMERSNLRRYLEAGGFIIMDNTAPRLPYNGIEASFHKMVRDIAGSQGRLAPIPNNHPLYHCLFDFDRAPIGREIGEVFLCTPEGAPSGYYARNVRTSKDVYLLEGVWFNGRLAGVYANKGYSQQLMNELSGIDFRIWYGYSYTYYSAYEVSALPTFERWSFSGTPEYHPPTFKFIANMVVYALLDPDGMTQRTMRAALVE